MSIQVKIRTALAALSKHGQNVTAACNVVVQMQRNSSLLSKLGAVTAGATLLGNVLKLPSPSKLLGPLAKYELPGVDVIGLLMRDHRPLPVGFAWDDGWKCAEFNGTCVYGNTNRRSFVYVDGDVANVEVSLRDGLWEQGHLRIAPTGSQWHDPLTIVGSVEDGGLPSERAAAIWRRVEPWIRAGRPRSLLVDGRPGTGKSTAIRWLAAQVGGRILRVPVSDLSNMRPTAVSSIVRLLRPDVVVIDDIDRGGGIGHMLDMIEEIRAATRLLVVSTNDLEFVPQAAVRPRRFDEVMTIDSLGDDFVRGFLGDAWARLDDAQRAVVLLWPMAYLEELRDRLAMLSDADPAAEVGNLEQRLTKRHIPSWALAAMAMEEAAKTKPATTATTT